MAPPSGHQGYHYPYRQSLSVIWLTLLLKNLGCLPGPVSRGRQSDRHAMSIFFTISSERMMTAPFLAPHSS